MANQNKLRYPIEILNPDMPADLPAPEQDEQVVKKQYVFANGRWKPTAEALERGENDFTDVCNVRQEGQHIEGVRGYASLCSINSNATFKAYSIGRTAIHLVSPYSAVKAYLLGQFWDKASLNSAVVLMRTASALANTEFIGSPLFSYQEGTEVGNFAEWPGNTLVHCNGLETKVFGGNEIRCGAFIQGEVSATGVLFSNARDVTDIVKTVLQEDEDTILVNASTGLNLFLGTVLPHGQAKFYVKNGNVSAAVGSVKVWNGLSWADIDTVVDGTVSNAGVPFGKTGTVSFTSALSTAQPRLINGYMLYWTQFNLTSGSAIIYHATADCPMQDVKDQWNGELLLNGKVLRKFNARYDDYTDYLNDDVDTTYLPIGTWYLSDYILLGYPAPCCGLLIDVDGTWFNHSIAITSTRVAYCDGASITSWPLVDALCDDTRFSSRPLAEGGLITWKPVSYGQEYKTAIKGEERLYYYKLYYTSGMVLEYSVRVWRVRGITSPQKILPYRFGFAYHNRPMLCGLDMIGEGNRVDYGQADTYAFFNGSDSSLGVDGRSLYFGEGGSLTAACEVFNRVGSTLYHVAVFTKDSETFILNGYNADTYQILQISESIGCPAPNTMDTIEIAYSKGKENSGAEDAKCIATWLSHYGPVIYDTTNIVPIWDDIACYFDPSDARCVNRAAIDKSVGWNDVQGRQYNLCIPSGVGQTTNNVWLFLDYPTNKWWKRSAPEVPQAVTKVTDDDGVTYVMGFFDTGKMRRLDSGPTYDGTVMSRYVETADQVPTGDMWDYTRMVRMKLVGGPTSETAMLSIMHAASGSATFTSLGTTSLNMSHGFIKYTQRTNLAAWSHRLKFAISGGVTDKGLKLVAWGAEYKREREDI